MRCGIFPLGCFQSGEGQILEDSVSARGGPWGEAFSLASGSGEASGGEALPFCRTGGFNLTLGRGVAF